MANAAHLAIRKVEEGAVKFVLETGKVDANWKWRYGNTPLWYAAMCRIDKVLVRCARSRRVFYG